MSALLHICLPLPLAHSPHPQSSPDRPFLDRSNAADLSKQTFYQLMEATWLLQVTFRFFLTQVSINCCSEDMVCCCCCTRCLGHLFST